MKKLTFKKTASIILTTIVLFMISGCATFQWSKQIIDFTITPEKGIRAGTIVVVNVKVSDEVEQVLGFIDMMGSPKIPLKYDGIKNLWYIRQMIPIGFMIPPGDYLTKVEAITKSGGHFYAEKKIIIE